MHLEVLWFTLVGLKSVLTGSLEAEVGSPVVIVKQAVRAGEPSTAAILHLIGALQSIYGLPCALVLGFFMRIRRFESPSCSSPRVASSK